MSRRRGAPLNAGAIRSNKKPGSSDAVSDSKTPRRGLGLSRSCWISPRHLNDFKGPVQAPARQQLNTKRRSPRPWKKPRRQRGSRVWSAPCFRKAPRPHRESSTGRTSLKTNSHFYIIAQSQAERKRNSPLNSRLRPAPLVQEKLPIPGRHRAPPKAQPTAQARPAPPPEASLFVPKTAPGRPR